jgi:hypothetical protein
MFAITKGQKCRLRMVPKDANGNYATVEKGTAKWASSDEAVLTVTPDADGLTATGEAIAQGVATVTATADASLEPNLTTEIKAVTNIGVQDAEAMSLEIVVNYMPQGGSGAPRPEHPIYYPPYPSTGPGFPTNPIQLPPWAGGPQPPFPGGGYPPVYPSHPIYWPPYPSQGPGFPTHPIQLPPWAGGSQPYPDQGLPGDQPHPDQGLPGAQPRPDQGLPPTAAPKK